MQSSALLIDHLVGLGHKKIMLLTASPDVNHGRHTRVKGLKYQIAQYGLEDSLFIRTKNSNWLSELSGEVNDYTARIKIEHPSVLVVRNSTGPAKEGTV